MLTEAKVGDLENWDGGRARLRHFMLEESVFELEVSVCNSMLVAEVNPCMHLIA